MITIDKSKVKLSVGIPSYNGAEYIRDALDSILSQLSEIDEKVEILISDNASTDKTFQIVREYQNKYPELISYHRNETNLGPDRNIDLAVRRSKGEYVWLFSNDDKMLGGAVKKVLNVLKANSGMAAIFINWRSASLDFKQEYKIGKYGITANNDIFFKNRR